MDQDKNNNRILVVDDDPVYLVTMFHIVSQLGFQVDTADSGEKALEILQAKPQAYALVFMDCWMSGMDGCSVVGQLKAMDEPWNLVKVIGVSAHGVYDRGKCLGAGMCDYLSKPVSLEKVEQLLRHHLPAQA